MKVASAVKLPDLYPDRHLNVFVPYGTHDLDYNVTRALISTLRWSRPQVTQEFLAEIVGLKGEQAASFQYDLQASDFEDYDPSRAKRKVILGISGEGRVSAHLPPLDAIDQPRARAALAIPAPGARLEALRKLLVRPDLDWDDVLVLGHALKELAEGSLPDGWIFATDGSLCVLMEAKLLRLLHKEQLDRHAELWFGRKREGEDLVLVSWSKIATFFDRRRDDQDPRTAFLSRQLFDYLDMLGFAPFEGFKPFDFDGDTLQDSMPKFRRFVDEAAALALSKGAPLAAPIATPFGSRIAFTNPGYLGEARVELSDAGIEVSWRVGEALSGSHPGSHGTDALLEATKNGHRNALSGLALSGGGFFVRVERLVEGPLGPAVDAETYSRELSLEDLGDALEALRLQNPREDRGRTPRRGALEIEKTIARDDALGGRESVVQETARLLLDVARLAERLAVPG